MSATVTRLPATPAVGLRETAGRFTGGTGSNPPPWPPTGSPSCSAGPPGPAHITTAAPAPNDSACLKVRGLWSDQDSEERGNSDCWAEMGGQR